MFPGRSLAGFISNPLKKGVAAAPVLGWGRPIAKALTENMGGAISMESELGKGSTLTFSFPAVF